ncbi:MAG: ADP-ribosylation factor-like protein [Promethearchaeota archaeon]
MPNILSRLLRGGKSFQVAIVGLGMAGKTAIVQRLMTDKFIPTTRTLGVDHRTVRYKSLSFKIMDLGGQKIFRETIWDEYVCKADAVIYVLDASDGKRIESASESFWLAMKSAKESVPVLFLANKADLPVVLPLSQIQRDLDLGKAARSGRPFHLFKISTKTGAAFYDAFDWLVAALNKRQEQPKMQRCAIDAIIIIDLSVPASTLVQFHKIPKNDLRRFTQVLSGLTSYLKDLDSGTDVISSENLQMVVVKKDHIVTTLICSVEDSTIRAQLICDRTIKHCDRMSKTTKRLLSESELRNFFERAFPLDIQKC